VSTTNDGKKRMEFVNRDFNAAIEERTLKLSGNSWKFVLPIGMRCRRSIQSPDGLVCE
jgi:hypothetical protein